MEQLEQMNQNPQLGVTLTSVLQLAQFDFEETVKQLSMIGIRALELNGLFEFNFNKLMEAVTKYNLEIPTIHIPLAAENRIALIKQFEKEVKIARKMNVQYVVIPQLPIHEQSNVDDLQYLIQLLSMCKEITHNEGLKLAVHNHTRELHLLNQEVFLLKLLEQSNQESIPLYAEFDLGWVYIAGYEPETIVQTSKSFCRFVHLKDFDTGRKECAVGKGIVGYKSIIPALKALQLDYMFINFEQRNLKTNEVMKEIENQYLYIINALNNNDDQHLNKLNDDSNKEDHPAKQVIQSKKNEKVNH